jgi:glycosyltransferase involved in cell wall biosynthesis
MKIGVDARSLLCREPRGEGKALLNLYRHISQLRSDIEIVLYGDKAAHDFRGELPTGWSVASLTWPGERFAAWENCYFPTAAMLAGCDVLHCTSSGGPFWSKLPQLLTIHDLIPVCFDDGQSIQEKRSFSRRLDHGLRNAKRVVTVSAHTKKDLLLTHPRLQTPVDVIHWGAEQVEASVPASTVDGPYVLSFGGEARRKNTSYTVQRFIAAAHTVANLKLVLVGVNSVRHRETILRQLAEAGLADRLVLPGFVSEAELDGLIRNARALIYLSLYEGFGLPVLEAISRGVPVIASDLTSIPEVLQGAPGCISLDDPTAIEHAIVTMATDPAERSRWQTAQAGILPAFDWNQTAAKTIAALEACLN